MKRTVFFGACCFGLSVLLLSGCQPAANTNQPVVVTSPSPERVDTASIQTELLRIENDWPRIIKEKDSAAVERVEAEDAVFIYPDGSIGDKAKDIKDTESGALSADSWELADLKVNVLDNDSAVVSGRSIVKGGKYKMPNGKTQDISGEYRWIDTYARRNGQWQLVAGASTPVMKDPAAKPTPSPAASPSPSTKASPGAKASPTTKPSPGMKAAPASSPVKTKTP